MARLSHSIFTVGVSLILTSLGVRAANAQCGSTNQAPRCTWRDHPGINTKGFADDIADNMASRNLQGYSLTVFGEDGNPEPVIEMSAGVAQVLPSGTTIPFDKNTISDLASVSKLLTEATVRHALEINWEMNGAYGSCPVRSHSTFLSALPSVFRKIAHPSYLNVTIEQLLNHQAGLENESMYDALRQDEAVGTCRVGAACYANTNYQLATSLVPLIRDCSVRSMVDIDVATTCAGASNRDKCEIERAFTLLGTLANSYAQSMLVDKYTTTADCGPNFFVSLGLNVARAFPGPTARPGGGLAANPEHTCGVGDWHMTSASVGRLMRHVWDGSFFNTTDMWSKMERIHNGSLTLAGGVGVYRSGAVQLDEASNLTLAFLTNSPMDARVMLLHFRNLVEPRRTGAAVPAPTRGMDRMRGNWNCALSGSNHVHKLRIANRYDARAYNPLEFGGFGSEEVWTTDTQSTFPNNDSASGSYVWFRAGMSPRFPTSTGTWELNRTSSSSATLRRTDANGWSGNYSCTRTE